jgi:hypothetical protein
VQAGGDPHQHHLGVDVDPIPGGVVDAQRPFLPEQQLRNPDVAVRESYQSLTSVREAPGDVDRRTEQKLPFCCPSHGARVINGHGRTVLTALPDYAKAAWKVAHYPVWLAGRSPARVSRQPILDRTPAASRLEGLSTA